MGFLPIHQNRLNRKEEIEYFIEQNQLLDYLIIDDDKSLNALIDKTKLVLTELLKGFDGEKLIEAKEKFTKKA